MMDRVPLGFGNLYASVGDHIGHFYETSEEGQEILVSFLGAGLRGRWRRCGPLGVTWE